MRFFLLFPFLLFSLSSLASDWRDSFYTDDSSYYLRLTPNGFIQRIQVEQKFCSQIESIEIIFKEKSAFQKRKISPLSWPKLYGMDESQFCFFEVEAKGLDLNKPKSNYYLLKIKTSLSDLPYYFGSEKESFLPQNRLFQDKNKSSWISLGHFGASEVLGGGVFFKIWEPMAQEVHLYVKGEARPFLMAPDDEACGLNLSHVLYLPSLKVGDSYFFKFLKKGNYETLYVGNFGATSDVKIDPMSKELDYDGKGGLYNSYLNPRSIVTQSFPSYVWKNDRQMMSLSSQGGDKIIYQIFPLVFNPKTIAGSYVQGKFKDIGEKIDYLEELGINTIEFLPINETRFGASWGYALESLTLIEKNLGSKDDLKELIDRFHEKSLYVIFDIVINHINNALLREPLSQSINETKFYKGDTGWGPKPDFSKPMVRKWIMDSLIYLIREFHIDGFRFDMVEYIYRNDPYGYRFLQEMNALFKMLFPKFYTSAEQLPNNVWITYPQKDQGAGFDTQWNDLFKNFFENGFDYYRPSNRHLDPYPLEGALFGYSNHINGANRSFHFGDPKRTVNYLSSHDFIGNKNPILRVVSDYKEMETDGRNTFFKVRPPRDHPSTFKMIHNDFTHATSRMSYAILFTKPGDLLFYQGEELGNDLNLENEWSYVDAVGGFPGKNVDIPRYISSHAMVWEFLKPQFDFLSEAEKNLFKGQLKFMKDLIAFRKNNVHISNQDAYNVRLSYSDSILTYQIGNPTEGEFFVVVNFGQRKQSAWIPFPGNAFSWWREIINSSKNIYGGQSDRYTNIIDNLGERSNSIRLEATSVSIFKRVSSPTIQKPLFLRGDFNYWEANSLWELRQNTARNEIFETSLEIFNSTDIEFKIATSDWNVDLGSTANRPFSFRPHFDFSGLSGYISYMPDSPNIKAFLKKGKYRFTFNIKTFEYSFSEIP